MTNLEKEIAILEAFARNAIGDASGADLPEHEKATLWSPGRAFSQAIAALREKLERQKGCDACVDNGAHLSCGSQRQVSEDESEQFGINPSYCPSCGRPLKEETQ